MLIFLAVLFLVLWALGFLAFHVSMWFIHLLLLVALISLIMHFLRGPARV
ncbi:lmo0937 family membrane protein [Fimbriimonas ginsengisoli]|uniref:Lmo0937 family membrane protein n=1 Tax=Fimbriimonas ginsengisoli Gsoil 348 TaxID=661478 RepID=A0A068NPI5_FIMGI|nr:lmo0937 family membrane protein [Fimbriimonas ginsengisoli]AIE85361.1 hypothetical protein OP10G_1993 [Fimbriimonas ginsengisoli Gsoil 348]